MKTIYIKNISIVNDYKTFTGFLYIKDGIIQSISNSEQKLDADIIIDGTGKYLFPGVIDDQVHFREPGLTHKAEIYTEAKAAVAGGTTSFMEMPNTKPQTTSIEELNKKFDIAAQNSLANYSFYLGATNDNIEEIKKINPKEVCGVKVFMGSSTGNMLVDKLDSLHKIFAESPVLIATHCEDEATIQNNLAQYEKQYGEDIPISAHWKIRSEEACYKSSSLAVQLAKKHNSRLHILHLSTKKELDLLTREDLSSKQITGEVCVHHLYFNNNAYESYGAKIKWNPAVKSEDDRLGLIEGLKNGQLDVIATDHAPHLWEEKSGLYKNAASGGPLVQHSLLLMLDFYRKGVFSLETIVDKMSHAPARLFNIEKRGFIKEGYFADLVIVNLNKNYTVSKNNILYKCGWSPFEGKTFDASIEKTIINGHVAYDNGIFDESVKGMKLNFTR